MRLFKIFLFFFLSTFTLYSQSGFQYLSDKKKIKIPFQLINNLIFIPMEVNGIELTFLLDTGVEETILFSLPDKKEVEFNQVETIKLKGLGSAAYIEGLKSSKNTISITPDFFDMNHVIYIILNEEINISSGVGIPVNGIMGFGFFKDYPMEIDYVNHKITVYKENSSKVKRRFKKFKEIPITLENSKPYIETNFLIETKPLNAKLLIDVGNSDAIWLFPNLIDSFTIPENNFNDLLGQGFSGPIYGKRARLEQFYFDNFKFQKPIIAFPDSLSIQNVKLTPNRVGSMGAEILRRFTLFIDYKNKVIGFKKNRNFSDPFHYNMSGLEIHHSGLQWVPEKMKVNSANVMKTVETMNFYYKFELKPIYVIFSVRKGSPAAEVGLQKDDIIISINNKESHLFSLQEINNLLKSEEGKRIKMEIQRQNQIIKFNFVLKSIF